MLLDVLLLLDGWLMLDKKEMEFTRMSYCTVPACNIATEASIALAGLL